MTLSEIVGMRQACQEKSESLKEDWHKAIAEPVLELQKQIALAIGAFENVTGSRIYCIDVEDRGQPRSIKVTAFAAGSELQFQGGAVPIVNANTHGTPYDAQRFAQYCAQFESTYSDGPRPFYSAIATDPENIVGRGTATREGECVNVVAEIMVSESADAVIEDLGARLDKAQPEFAVGDVVRLKSGGPLMTVGHVKKFTNAYPPLFACAWFDDDGVVHRKEFAGGSLIR